MARSDDVFADIMASSANAMFTCEICAKCFALNKYLRQHFRQKHGGETMPECRRRGPRIDASTASCVCGICGSAYSSTQ